MSDAVTRLAVAVAGALFGLGLVSAWAQAPLAVPDWVVRYAGEVEQRQLDCQRLLAQERDRSDKLVKELTETKASLAAKEAR